MLHVLNAIKPFIEKMPKSKRIIFAAVNAWALGNPKIWLASTVTLGAAAGLNTMAHPDRPAGVRRTNAITVLASAAMLPPINLAALLMSTTLNLFDYSAIIMAPMIYQT